jgi:2-isopropylmalate synthase
VEAADPRLAAILAEVKDREDRGYAYDGAAASFELLARRMLGALPRYFEVERYRVTTERRMNAKGVMVTVSEAVVVAQIGNQRVMSVSESQDPLTLADQGPVNALSRALAKDLGPYQPYIDRMRLVDFRVRITSRGTEAVTRVLIDSEDDTGRRWSTVGVSANIVDASFQALNDAVVWKLLHDGAPIADAA